MRRYLLVALWPAGMAAITAATVAALRRERPPDSRFPAGQGRPAPAGEASPDDPGPAGTGPRSAFNDGPERALPGWRPGLVELGAVSAGGGALSYGLMVLLGRPIVRHGPRIDVPIMEWTSSHQVEPWAATVERLNKIANTWTAWGSCGTAAACLATTWRTRKWLPPSVLGAAVLVDHYVTLALRHKFGRPGPPASPLGTYPSGGCDRVVLFYGLIANLLWREFSGSYRGRVMAVSATSLLAFNTVYCRTYLSKHWFTDSVTGLLYGALLYGSFAAAVRLIGGPPARPRGPEGAAPGHRLDGQACAGHPGRPSGGEREGAPAGVGEPVSTRPAGEHRW
jgi:hypothetical protein